MDWTKLKKTAHVPYIYQKDPLKGDLGKISARVLWDKIRRALKNP